MNKERMLELADELENPKRFSIHFSMRDFVDCWFDGQYRDEVSNITRYQNCGTTACIGGHACIMFGEPGSHIGKTQAKLLLDLTEDQANRLFYNSEKYITEYNYETPEFEDITRTQAAAAVRRMVEEEGDAEPEAKRN